MNNLTTQSSAAPVLFGTSCINCRTRDCCNRLGPNGNFTNPFLSETDIRHISEFTRLGKDDFVVSTEVEGESISTIKVIEGRCVFSTSAGKCEIYGHHPIDCKLFPLDIDWQNGEYIWIIYDPLCNFSAVDLEENMKTAESSLLPHFTHDEFQAYADYGSEMLFYRKSKWKHLRTVHDKAILWASVR